jgi:hypothetical protein
MLLRIIFVLLTSCVFAFPVWAQPSNQEEPVTEGGSRPGLGILGWTITPGIGVRILDINVTDRRTGARGNITNDGSFSDPIYFSFDVESPTLVLGNVGLTVRAHTTSFELSNQRFNEGIQNEDDKIHDVGTEISGRYSYVMPTLFYRWTDLEGDSRLGLGYGKWDAKFSGDALLSDDLGDASIYSGSSVRGSADGKKGLMMFWQWRFAKGLLEFSINEVDFTGTDYKFDLSELNMMYGYYFEL